MPVSLNHTHWAGICLNGGWRGRGLGLRVCWRVEPGLRGHSAGCLLPEEVDMLLQRCEGGVDVALNYAKNMAKYMKDLIGYLEKRTALGECWPGVRSARGPPPLTCPLLTPLPAALTPLPCRDGLCQRPAEDCPQLQTERHAGGGATCLGVSPCN